MPYTTGMLGPRAALAVAALCAFAIGDARAENHVDIKVLAGVRRPRPGRPPKTYTRIDRDYENLRAGMRSLFTHLAINTAA